jgi:uncharacterized protein YerC
MRVSKKPVNSHLLNELDHLFHQAVADLKTPQEAQEFFKSFLSKAEHTTVIKRVGVAYFLQKGKSYNIIKQDLKVSSATISLIQNTLNTPGVQRTLKKINAEEWATQWSNKLKGLVKLK